MYLSYKENFFNSLGGNTHEPKKPTTQQKNKGYELTIQKQQEIQIAYDTLPPPTTTHTQRKANENTIFSLIFNSKEFDDILNWQRHGEIHCYWEVWTDTMP